MAGEEIENAEAAKEIDVRFATIAIVATSEDVQGDRTIRYWPAGSDGKRYTMEEAEASGLLVQCIRKGISFYRSAEGKIVVGEDWDKEIDTPTLAFDEVIAQERKSR